MGVDETVQMEAIAIVTSKEHAFWLDEIMKQQFPTNNDDMEFYVSYLSKLDNRMMGSLYLIQNKWLSKVKALPVGFHRNIDRQYEVGLSWPVSLREFVRAQPADPNQYHFPMDIENGGRKGKPVIIVLPKHVKAAKNMFQDFEDLVKQHKSEALAVADGQSVTSGDSNPSEDDYMT